MALQLQNVATGSCATWRTLCSLNSAKIHHPNFPPLSPPSSSVRSSPATNAVGVLAAAVVLASPPTSEETLSNIPTELSGESCDSNPKDCGRAKGRIQRPKSEKAESCTIKCVTTCIRGGDGAPGEGPLNIRRPIVVFKQGFRSRQYCLVECSDICNLLDGADKGR